MVLSSEHLSVVTYHRRNNQLFQGIRQEAGDKILNVQVWGTKSCVFEKISYFHSQ